MARASLRIAGLGADNQVVAEALTSLTLDGSAGCRDLHVSLHGPFTRGGA